MLLIKALSNQANPVPESSDVFTPDPRVEKLAQEFDRIYFPLFLESLNAIKNNDTLLISKYFDKNDCDTASSNIDIPLLNNYNTGCKPAYINPLDNSRYEVEFPVQWEVPGYSDPSWNLGYKSLKWLGVYLNSTNSDSVFTAFKILDDYIRSHVDYPDPDSRFTFGDHASAERLKILTKAYLKYCETGLHQEQFKVVLQNAILSHIFYLSSLEFYASWTNHAIIVDNALIESLRLLEDFKLRQKFLELAFARVFEQLRYSFTSEGIHKEHSPCYHLTFSGTMGRIIKSAYELNVEVPGEIKIINEKAIAYNQFITDNGQILPIGDCSRSSNKISSVKLSNPRFKVYSESGWAFFKDTTLMTDIIIQADFHSFSHYQNDEFSFILNVGGHELIIDPGLYSYNTASPFSEYMRSGFAHNVLIVDNLDYNPNLTNTGLSGITRFYSPDKYENSATGVLELTHPHYLANGVDVFREFAFFGGNTIVIRDSYHSISSHNYYQLFHLAPGARVDSERNCLIVSWPDHSVCLRMESNANNHYLVEGSKKPYQGWYFPEFGKAEPSPVLILKRNDKDGVFDTKIKIFTTSVKEEINNGDRRKVQGLLKRLQKIERRKLFYVPVIKKWKPKRW